MSRRTQAVILPDGIERTPLDTQHDAIDWGISPKRTVALCFGSLARRKGVFKLLDALPYLSKATQKQLAIVFAGVVARSERDAFYASMAQMRNETDVQLVVDDRFVADAEVQPMIKRADLILVTYQHHIGSSNVLIRAADAGIPVLGSNYGVIGAQIHDFTLGVAVDTTISKEIAAGLELHVNQKDSINFNKETARRFAASHDAAMYAKTIFSTLGFV